MFDTFIFLKAVLKYLPVPTRYIFSLEVVIVAYFKQHVLGETKSPKSAVMYGLQAESRTRLLSVKHKLNRYIFVRFDVFTAVTMKNAVFWDVTPCRYCVNRRFGGTYRLHLPGIKIRDSVCSHLLTLVPRFRIFILWRWRRYVPPKHRFTKYLHGATSQKTVFFNYIGFRVPSK
jgi:hypothetical protein